METPKAANNRYVFFYVGDDITQPQMLASSIRRVDVSAEIVHCADTETPEISGIDRRVNVEGDRRFLMSYRLKAFANSLVDGPAVYMDTDMLCLRPIESGSLTKVGSARFCRREFACDLPFNGRFRNMDLMEYDRLALGTVYPYVACTTITNHAQVWAELLATLESMSEKFRIWYGDQEAIKAYVVNHGIPINQALPESKFGCLPEYFKLNRDAYALHFKGSARKSLMEQVWGNFKDVIDH